MRIFVTRMAANWLFGGAELLDGLMTVITLGLYDRDYVSNAAWTAISQWAPSTDKPGRWLNSETTPVH